MDVGLQQPKTSQFPWVSHPDAVPVEIWETPPAVRRRGVSHIPTGCRIQLGFYSFKCDKGGIAFSNTYTTVLDYVLQALLLLRRRQNFFDRTSLMMSISRL